MELGRQDDLTDDLSPRSLADRHQAASTPGLSISSSDGLWDWLDETGVSIAFTTYQ